MGPFCWREVSAQQGLVIALVFGLLTNSGVTFSDKIAIAAMQNAVTRRRRGDLYAMV